jgi:hypothetical protein
LQKSSKKVKDFAVLSLVVTTGTRRRVRDALRDLFAVIHRLCFTILGIAILGIAAKGCYHGVD